MQPEISDQILYSFLTGRFSASTTTTSLFYPFVMDEETSSQDKALAAMRNHKEAERRRRERINSHLNILRSLLSCNSKIDKATLLAKVVQRVKELKQQTLEISDQTIPSEEDNISVLNFEDCPNEEDGRIIFKLSFCCDDKPNLLQDVMEILNSLHMNTLYADMTTIGGRMRNHLVVSADKEHHGVESVKFLQNALKSLLERSVMMERSGGGGGERLKRRRAVDHIIMV